VRVLPRLMFEGQARDVFDVKSIRVDSSEIAFGGTCWTGNFFRAGDE
jgi:hypothetical protein